MRGLPLRYGRFTRAMSTSRKPPRRPFLILCLYAGLLVILSTALLLVSEDELFSLQPYTAMLQALDFLLFLVPYLAFASGGQVRADAADPCALIAGKEWASPQEVRACFTSFPVDPSVKANIIEVVNKTLAFHTSVNYQIRAPEPFSQDVHEDLMKDLARISAQAYPSDFDLHVDLSRTLKRLNDGHCVYINDCYDSTFLTFLPTPLVHLTDSDGIQSVHIAPEAFEVARAAFGDEVSFWQNALEGNLKGQLESLSGAKILEINGQDPFESVDANAAITGSFEGFGTRQNSYQRTSTAWNYVFGNFAQQSLPIIDQAVLTIQRVNSTSNETILLPYRSQLGTTTKNFTNGATFRANNCVAVNGTNGVDLYASFSAEAAAEQEFGPNRPIAKFQQQPRINPADARKHAVDVLLDDKPISDAVLPPTLQPPGTPLPGSSSVAQFFLLPDNVTGVFALGSFSDTVLDTFLQNMLTGLQNLRSQGATQLIVDVTNNGGGFICAAHWLHRIIVGPKSTSVPQAGLDTKTRAGPLAQLIVEAIVKGADPDSLLMYNPDQWRFANNTPFPASFDWLQQPVRTVINGHPDAFSLRIGNECQPFDIAPPQEALFDPSKVAIVSNGRCASSCSLFSITMAKEEGAKTVVVGGKSGVKQEYCGTVGGQSSDFSTMDTEVKSTKLKNNPLAPPDFVQGITWRLAFGVDDTTQPEEWQDHPADVNLPLTPEIVNNPNAIWQAVAKVVLSGK
ncbi:hypothetical protein EVG20_g3099 [Dentipellis fragilis]|uniref:Tail specific protease domain-containing protein n=1 Tax=Dentipellis fragilis TaxID=205917 RepID=A0A4Y9Z4R5_9AGAM|nr:hypothetical protein EVG20_g3099 [Dentipellis fragilis]